MLNMPNGQVAPDLSALTGGSGVFPGTTSGSLPNVTGFPTQAMPMGFPQLGPNGMISQQTTDGFQQSFPQRSSEEEERLRQQVAAISRLLDDWMQFTEEKWRTVSDSQLGWKPLRGRWSNWDDIFQDAYAAKTSDPMARAAQAAGEATARRFDFSKEKGSAASAVACFMRDMLTLRQGLEMMQSQIQKNGEAETPNIQPAVQPFSTSFGGSSTSQRGGFGGGSSPRNSLIRRPSPIYVDADASK